MIYVIKFKVGVWEREFHFEDSETAMRFAETALTHSVDCEDNERLEAVFVIVKPKEIPATEDDIPKWGGD